MSSRPLLPHSAPLSSAAWEAAPAIQWASFNHRGTRIFTTWVEPRAGSSSTLIQAYYLHDERWFLFLGEAAASRDISVLITPADNKLVYLTTDRRAFLSRSLTELKPLYPTETK